MPAIGQALASHTSSTPAQNSGTSATGGVHTTASTVNAKVAGRPHKVSPSPTNPLQEMFTEALRAKQERDFTGEGARPKTTTQKGSRSRKSTTQPRTSTQNAPQSDSTPTSSSIPQFNDYSGDDIESGNDQSSATTTRAPYTTALLTASSLLGFGMQGLQQEGLWQATKSTPPSTTNTLTPNVIEKIIGAAKTEPAYTATDEDIKQAADWIKASQTEPPDNDGEATVEDEDTGSEGATNTDSQSPPVVSHAKHRHRRSTSEEHIAPGRCVTKQTGSWYGWSGRWNLERYTNRCYTSVYITFRDTYYNKDDQATLQKGKQIDLFPQAMKNFSIKMLWKDMTPIATSLSYISLTPKYEQGQQIYIPHITITKENLLKLIKPIFGTDRNGQIPTTPELQKQYDMRVILPLNNAIDTELSSVSRSKDGYMLAFKYHKKIEPQPVKILLIPKAWHSRDHSKVWKSENNQ